MFKLKYERYIPYWEVDVIEISLNNYDNIPGLTTNIFEFKWS